MSKHTQWIEHRGKKILVSDYSNLDETGQIEAMNATIQELQMQPIGGRVLTLTNVSNARSTAATRDKGKEVEAVVKERKLVSHTAIVGVSSWQKVMVQLIKPGAYCAASVEEAKDWLVGQAEQ